MKTLGRHGCTALLLGILAVAACGCRARDGGEAADRTLQADRYLVGAYYYTWYPRNFSQGYLRRRLAPPQLPALGVYKSADVATAEQHIAWASRYGVDFFAVGWWPSRPKQNQVLPRSLLKARNIGDVKFCIFYETWALGFFRERGMTIFDLQKADRFVADMVSIAEEYFHNPSYLTVDGRPVVVLYLGRTLTGGFEVAIERARRELRSRGFDPFFVGDEIFWKVAPLRNAHSGPVLTRQPQVARIRAFDAITGYNLYENDNRSQGGYAAGSTFVRDAAKLYEDYRSAAGPGVYLVPGVIPGYNDRGVRPAEDHYVIPRQWAAGAPEGSALAELLERLALRFVDPRLNMVLISTWNEWNEDTAIEPLAPAPPTTADVSPSGREFTQGYAYAGHGTAYLEVVRDKVVAVAGRLTDAAGVPLWGVEVTATGGGSEVARARSDRDGYYRLSRLRMPPGSYLVSVAGVPEARPVEVRAAATTAGVDFTGSPVAAPFP